MSNQKKLTAKVLSEHALREGQKIELSDWQITCPNANGTISLFNLEIQDESEEKLNHPYEIKKGAWRITPKEGLQKINFSENDYTYTKTYQELSKYFTTFKENLDQFDFLGIKEKKRGVLLGSVPGVGKSKLICKFCQDLQKEENACILFIDNEGVDFEQVQAMFRSAKAGTVDFIVLVIEDIGGSDLDSRRHHVDSTLLNFLDGQGGLFHTPTLVVGTTNYLDQLQKSVTSRPGRFDVVLQVECPGFEESVELTENFIKRELSEPEREAIKEHELTPAYLKECVIRHKLDNVPLEEAIKEVVSQRKKSETNTHSYIDGEVGF